MRLFKRSPNYKVMAILSVIFVIVCLFAYEKLQQYAEGQDALRLPYEELIFKSDVELSQHCGLFKWKRFCPEYCRWDADNKNQHCGIDLEAFSAVRESYEDYLAYLLKKGSISMKEISKNETAEVTNTVAGKSPESLKYINDESTLIEIIKNDPASIRFIKNPSETVQLMAVKQNGCVIEYIENPGKTLLEEAVKNCPTALNLLKDLPDDIVKLAIESYPEGINYLENPTSELKALAQRNGYFPDEYIKFDEENIKLFQQLVKKLAPTLTEEQIQQVPWGNFRHPKPHTSDKPDETEVRMALKRDVSVINQIRDYYPEMEQEIEGILRVVDEPETVLAELEKPYDELKILELLFINPYIIKYLDQPTEEQQVFAVFIDPNTFQYIKNPAERIAMYQSLGWNCDRDYPEIADLPDDNEWQDVYIDFKGNMPKEEAVKILRENGIRILDTGMYDGGAMRQIYGSIQKNKAEYIWCKVTSQSTQAMFAPIFL